MIGRAGEHRLQGFQIQISGFTPDWKLDILHGGQRNTQEQIERTALEMDKGLDVDDFRNRTICRMDNRGKKHQPQEPFCNTHVFESVYAGKTM
ncbi:MAG: hypothetical protein DMF88_09040 [Acidobacteria bacterium]|nr:MAG: hypothetical protein DMF88_09040 [Acidobacteriota bacterium]